MKPVLRTILHYFNLERELEDHDVIHEEITKGIVFRGTNLWILVFAIIIASVGLNMNSTAVIIGAMLISPLMGPINGMGYSIATYNFQLFRRSVKNFSFAVITSLITSTLYFAISPISTAHSELLARTSPSIYDVIIALFGGLAGIVAIGSRLKGNVIPGVAIATALMPPLCTAGYGLATGQFDFFLGAIYLFTINTVFIALASVIISQILKFPIRTLVEPKDKVRVNRWISAVITVVLLPSIYFGYLLVQKERFIENANRYVQSVGTFEGNYLLGSDIEVSKKTISLVYGGTNLDDMQKGRIRQQAMSFDLKDATVIIRQGINTDQYESRYDLTQQLREEIARLNTMIKSKDYKIDSLQNTDAIGRDLFGEIKSLYPQIISCSFAQVRQFSDTAAQASPTPLLIIKSDKPGLTPTDRERIQQWAARRLQSREVKLIVEE